MRQLKVPINISIQKALVIRDLDILPAASDANCINNEIIDLNSHDKLNKLTKEFKEENYSMLSLIIYNKCNFPFNINFFVRNDNEGN